MEEPTYKRLAVLIQAIRNCQESGNREWEDKHTAEVESLVKEKMPSGGGFDNGTTSRNTF